MTIAVVTIGDFAFKTLTANAFGDDRAGMVGYFGMLAGVTGILSLAIHLAVTRWLMARAGVAAALAMLPLLMGGGFAAVAIAPSLLTATLLRGADLTFRYTVNDSAMQMLYLPVPGHARGRFKALLETVIRPGAELTAGAALLAYLAVWGALTPVAVTGMVGAAVWLALVARMRRAYVSSLTATMRARRLELAGTKAVPDEEVLVIRDALRSGAPAVVAHALELARASADVFHQDAAALIAHPSAPVRRTVCQVLAALGRRRSSAGADHLARRRAGGTGRGRGGAGAPGRRRYRRRQAVRHDPGPRPSACPRLGPRRR